MAKVLNSIHALVIAENSMSNDSIEYQDSIRKEEAEKFAIFTETLELSDKRVVEHLGWNEGKG